jgi:rRNA maturation endonuclease Nob1
MEQEKKIKYGLQCVKCKQWFERDSDEIMDTGLDDNKYICEECASC